MLLAVRSDAQTACLGEEGDDEEELAKCSMANSHSGLILKYFTKLTCFHIGLAPNRQKTNYTGTRKYFRIHNPWQRVANRQCCNNYYLGLYTAFCILSAIFFMVMLYLAYMRKELLPFGRLDVRNGIHRPSAQGHSDICAYRNETYVAKPHKALKLAQIDSWMSFFGCPFKNFPCFDQYNYAIVVIMLVKLGAFAWIQRNNTFLMEPLSFMYAPIEHRALVSRRVNMVISHLLLENRRRTIRPRIKFPASPHNFSSHQRLLREMDTDFDDMDTILRYISNERLVQPACVSLRCLKRLVWQMFEYTYIVTCPAAALFLQTQCVEYLGDLYFVVMDRLDLLECQRWAPGLGVRVGKFVGLMPELTHEHEHSMYAEYDHSIGATLRLIWDVELAKKSNAKTVLHLCLFTHTILLCLFAYYVLFIIYFLYLEYFSSWVDQLDRQLGGCIETLRAAILNEQHSFVVIQDYNHRGQYEDDSKSRPMQFRKATVQLMIAYVNFELFHMRFKRIQRFLDIVVTVTLVTTFESCISCYIIGLKANVLMNAMMIGCANLFVILLNVFLVGYIVMVRKISHQSKTISRMIGLATLNKLELSPAICMWRRRLITERECRDLFSPKIFAFFRISYKNFITMNLYIFGIWLLLTRSFFAELIALGTHLLEEWQKNNTTTT